VLPLDAEYVQQAAKLCAERGWLLLMDEVQTGIGRTGEWFAFKGLNVKPDAVSFAKGIAGGLPFGGFLTGEKLKAVLGPGDHATTFGGTPLCAAAALAVLKILAPALPEVEKKGAYIRDKIEAMGLEAVDGTRGRGLMIGVKIKGAAPKEINAQLLEAGLVGLTAGSDALRFLPPLTITMEEIDKGLAVFEAVMHAIQNSRLAVHN
jgi:acetylornithine/N-succinyldiaminopimelate aminotransferase